MITDGSELFFDGSVAAGVSEEIHCDSKSELELQTRLTPWKSPGPHRKRRSSSTIFNATNSSKSQKEKRKLIACTIPNSNYQLSTRVNRKRFHTSIRISNGWYSYQSRIGFRVITSCSATRLWGYGIGSQPFGDFLSGRWIGPFGDHHRMMGDAGSGQGFTQTNMDFG